MNTSGGAPGQVLCTYRYDPLDRLSSVGLDKDCQRFYLKDRLASEIKAGSIHTVFRYDDTLLATHVKHGATHHGFLLATDRQGSVLCVLKTEEVEGFVYTPYGHHIPSSGFSSLLGFNGERADDVTGHYLLGNGYRAFNAVIMRFNSPDSLSPFGSGGLNTYAYCGGDPVNRIDPDGGAYSSVVYKAATKFLSLIGRQPRAAAFAPRLTRMSPDLVKAKRLPQRLIANIDDSSPLKALPEESVAPTPREWYLLEGSKKELLNHHRRYVKPPKQMLSEKRRSIRQSLSETIASESAVRPSVNAGFLNASKKSERLQSAIAVQRQQAGRVGFESPLGLAFDLRKGV